MNGLLSSSLWLVGFRPFFIGAFVSAILLPLTWVLVLSGLLDFSRLTIGAVQWHAHEMLFGFGWAVMAGFLLTASKNWVKIRGLHGGPLIIAVLAWVVERFSFFVGFKGLLLFLASSVSVAYVAGYVFYSLVKGRERDSFKDNWLFIVALPLFLLSKFLLLQPTTFHLGWTMAVGLFRLAFIIMLERTTTQFMKTSFSVSLYRNPLLDMTIKCLSLLCVFEAFLPQAVSTLMVMALAVAVMMRLVTWQPWLGLSKFGTALMYAGHIAIPVHLTFYALMKFDLLPAVGDVATHVFAFGTMGTIIPAMCIRIAQGHTGRPIVFTSSDRIAIGLVWLGGLFRIAAPQLWPLKYLLFITASAVCWSLCFGIVGYRIVPYLLQPRVDGREH